MPFSTFSSIRFCTQRAPTTSCLTLSHSCGFVIVFTIALLSYARGSPPSQERVARREWWLIEQWWAHTQQGDAIFECALSPERARNVSNAIQMTQCGNLCFISPCSERVYVCSRATATTMTTRAVATVAGAPCLIRNIIGCSKMYEWMYLHLLKQLYCLKIS